MRRTFERALTAGITSAAILAGCGEDKGQPQEPSLVVEVAYREHVVIFDRPYDQEKGPGESIGVLKVGSKALATCFYQTPINNRSSVKVEGSVNGYSNVYSHQGGKDESPEPIFDKHIDELKKLPPCADNWVEAKPIDLTNAEKTGIEYHEDPFRAGGNYRTYEVSDSGYELIDSNAKDFCGVEGQFLTSVNYRGFYILAQNREHKKNACEDGQITPADFEK